MPESPDTLSMHGFPQRVETRMHLFGGQHPFIQAHSASASFGSSRSDQRLIISDPYCPPWNPLMTNVESGGDDSATRQSGGLSYGPNYASFSGFRDPQAPSEADSVNQSAGRSLRDSAYGTMTRESVGNPSVYGGDMDQSVETRSLIVPFQRGVTISAEENSQKRQGKGQKSASATLSADTLICPGCSESVRTPSELKLSSSADLGTSEVIVLEEGGSTNPNPASPLSWAGLDPDTAASTRLLNALGGSPRYMETGDAIQFTSPTRSVEERDLSTLRGDNMTQFVPGQNLSRNTPLTSQDTDSMLATLYGQGAPLQSNRATSTEGTPLAEQASCVVPDVLCHTGTEFRSPATPRNAQAHPREAIQLDDDVPEAAEEDSRSECQKVEADSPDEAAVDESLENAAIDGGLHDTDVEDSSSESPTDEAVKLSPGRDAGSSSSPKPTIKAPPAEQESGIDTSRHVDLSEEGSVVRSLMDRGILEKVLIEVGYLKPPEPDTKDQPPPVNPPVPADKDGFKCDECPKTFPRHCELKKHRKRHAKPYACTFARCFKTFGSKNDWKRHETSQHCQPEIWRCDEDSPKRPGEECGKAWHRRESLKSHLQKDHDIQDHDTLEKKLADCRIGRNFESRFWCGFCRKIIEPIGKVGPAHSERFDHVDAHFSGKDMPKANIKDWKYMDAGSLDALGTPGMGKLSSSSSAAKSRKRFRGTDDDADAVVRSKRTKGEDVQKDLYWICCVCGNYWSKETTSGCMDAACNHVRCKSCEFFADEAYE
ncbi:Transcriptional regulator CRZ2 [Madurella mycetomatis]|uniref:Transcriptional regulator CRZ2 n=1 Tax=Madurella mycetomatis TaxID=100816 RepID=A0A175W734_9PEZI|nr:Transcriptional regulator CRZ2 [Madurella mycetomatis]